MMFVASDILVLLSYVSMVPSLVRALCTLVDLRGERGVVCDDAAFSDIIDELKWSYDCVCVAMIVYVCALALLMQKYEIIETNLQ